MMKEARETRITWIAIAATLGAGVLAGIDLVGVLWERVVARAWLPAAAQVVFILIAAGMIYGSLVYQFTRAGYLKRRSRHREPPADEIIDEFLDGGAQPVVTVVPSYKEDTRLVR